MLPNYERTVEIASRAIRHYPWENKMAYAQFLAQTYYYVCHSIRLLAASAARFDQKDQVLHRRFLKHAEEENSHELIALRDLQKLGYKIEDFPEFAQTKTMYEIQYFKIEHIDPVALMGYILVLETMAGRDFKWLKEKLTPLYGKECVKFVQVHADDDPDHIVKALEIVKDLRTERLKEINVAMEQSAICYSDMLKEATERTLGKDSKKAA